MERGTSSKRIYLKEKEEKEKLEFFPKASYFTPIGDSASPVTTLQHAYIFICRYFLI
jgi:hypothetical protein